MALPRAAQCRRNPAHRALAVNRACGADNRGDICALDGAGAWVCVFPLAPLAAVDIPDSCSGGTTAAALPSAVNKSFPSGGSCGGHPVAGVNLPVRHGAARPVLSLFRLCDGGRGLSLGPLGNGGHGSRRGRAAGGRSVRGASRTGTGGGSLAAPRTSAAPRCKRAGTGTAAAVHEFGLSDCARIFARLYVGKSEESARGT